EDAGKTSIIIGCLHFQEGCEWFVVFFRWLGTSSRRVGFSCVMGYECSVFSVQWSVFSIQCSVFSVQYSVFSGQCSVFSIQYSVFSIQYSVARPSVLFLLRCRA